MHYFVVVMLFLLLNPSVIISQEESGLEYIQEFSAFIRNDIVISRTLIEGRMAAGGSVTLNGCVIGEALMYNCSRVDLIASGEYLSMEYGGVQRGSIIYKKIASIQDASNGCNVEHIRFAVINFDESFNELNQTAYNIKNQLSTGIITQNDSSIILQGYEQEQNYFSFDSQMLSENTTIFIDIPDNSFASISISGQSIDIQELSVSISDTTDPQKILWNIYEALNIKIDRVQIFGSIIAPNANFTVFSGNIEGSIAAISLKGRPYIVYSPYIPINSNCTCISCPPEVNQLPYSMVVYDTISNLTNSQITGRLVAGGNVNLYNCTIGEDLPVLPVSSNATNIGGNLEYVVGTVYNGNIVVEGTASIGNITIVNGVIQSLTSISIDFSEIFKTISLNSKYLSVLMANGISYFSRTYPALNLSGSDFKLNVFYVISPDFNSIELIEIDCPPDSYTVVNVPGITISLNIVNVFVANQAASRRLIFNFYEATTITLSNVEFAGLFLAPFADIEFENALFDGTVVCNSINGNNSTTTKNFILPFQPPCTPCSC